MKKRIDQWLVEKGLASSRTQAKDLIDNKQVFIWHNGIKTLVTKASQTFSADGLDEKENIEIADGDIGQFVSRGGLKLAGALDRLRFSVNGLNAIDVGVSTGGFTDVLLQRGAALVFGLEVGHGQTHEKIRANSRFQLVEGINVKELDRHPEVTSQFPQRGFDLAVVDVSFIRLELIWPQIYPFLRSEGHLLSLVKPQFELGPASLGKNGIVKDEHLYGSLRENLDVLAKRIGFHKLDYFESSIQGKDGNREFFMFASKR